MNALAPNDAFLVAATLAGDESAFAVLVGRYKRPLYRYVHRYIRDESEAQDILQEALIAAWRGLRSYDPQRPLEFWLRRIALNKCRDRARRQAVRRILMPWTGSAREAADPSPGVDESMIEDEQQRLARNAINALPDRLRDPLILTALEGLSQGEAAEILGITVKAVEGAVYRAKKQLTEALRLKAQPCAGASRPRMRAIAEPRFCKIDSITW